MDEKEFDRITEFLDGYGLGYLAGSITACGKVDSFRDFVSLDRRSALGIGLDKKEVNLLMAALEKNEEIEFEKPEYVNMFSAMKIPALSLVMMENADLFHSGVLVELNDDDLREIGIKSVADRKRILCVIEKKLREPERDTAIRKSVTSGVCRGLFLFGFSVLMIYLVLMLIGVLTGTAFLS